MGKKKKTNFLNIKTKFLPYPRRAAARRHLPVPAAAVPPCPGRTEGIAEAATMEDDSPATAFNRKTAVDAEMAYADTDDSPALRRQPSSAPNSTRLDARNLFDDLLELHMHRAAAPKEHLDTCYDFSGAAPGGGSVKLPKITLVFDGPSAAMELDPSGVRLDGCLAFAPNSDDQMTGIIGNVR
ncbi:uncharacterized protein LOC112270146 [Brachypodium distachyon]|uniref:Uncharacterized protein n=1 Tax=Brachypodium distachyon TaxID=15368 RepID=A0A2K2DQJ6_BRADI|nr:uncharacterized protein LOC112270146 [Brachypodium distachyon]PNT76555.1 hypothetical protein BRADI_1g49452v3 [Brachypodium distachyon]|eukprot:XP_024313683.1 uncharacterized protein LOC112270146 [Brachypodium distachyon]